MNYLFLFSTFLVRFRISIILIHISFQNIEKMYLFFTYYLKSAKIV